DVDLVCIFFFFFSSRRRHTRSYGDWSSDVCSSDLIHRAFAAASARPGALRGRGFCGGCRRRGPFTVSIWVEMGESYAPPNAALRSEERRVGKEGRIRGGGGA